MLSERNYFLNVWKSPLSQKILFYSQLFFALISTEEHKYPNSCFVHPHKRVHSHPGQTTPTGNKLLSILQECLLKRILIIKIMLCY